MNVTIFGTGYVGLVTGACFAESGNNIMCVDVDEAKIEGLKNGIVPIYEPGLPELVEQNYAAGRLQFTTNAQEGIDHGRFIFIAVGTPPNEDGSSDLKYVEAVAGTIGDLLSKPAIIVNNPTPTTSGRHGPTAAKPGASRATRYTPAFTIAAECR